MRTAILILVVLLDSSPAWARKTSKPSPTAASCSTIDLRAQLGPPRAQGETGWCFAHTTADLISQAIGRRVSAFPIAKDFVLSKPEDLTSSPVPEVRAYVQENPDVIDRQRADLTLDQDELRGPRILGAGGGFMNVGGEEDAALLLANAHGFCDDAKLPSGDDAYFNYLKEVSDFHRAKLAETGRPCAVQAMSETPAPHHDVLRAITANISDVIKKHITEWTDRRCGERSTRRPPLIPEVVTVAGDLADLKGKLKTGRLTLTEARSKLFGAIDRNLERGRVSAIGYDYNETAQPEPDDNSPGDHSSIIAARKMIGGSCRYFIRNSFGPDCSLYRAKYANPPLCEAQNGGVWIKQEELKSLYSVISVK